MRSTSSFSMICSAASPVAAFNRRKSRLRTADNVSRMPSSSSTIRTVFRRSGIGGASIARLLDTSEFSSITWGLDRRTMTFLWLVTGASLVVALIALGQARRTAKRLEQLTQNYWELKYQNGELRGQLQQLTGESAPQPTATPIAAQG